MAELGVADAREEDEAETDIESVPQYAIAAAAQHKDEPSRSVGKGPKEKSKRAKT